MSDYYLAGNGSHGEEVYESLYLTSDICPAVTDVFFDRSPEEDRLLANNADLISEPAHVQVLLSFQ